MTDTAQALTRTSARTDLHAAVVAEVVDHVDAGEREIGIRHIAVPPAACRAQPGVTDPGAPQPSAEVAGPGKGGTRRHGERLRRATDARASGARDVAF